MTTELKRFTEAYATMTVAAYEPLILRWISLIGIQFISSEVATRLPKAIAVKYDRKMISALALGKTIRKPIPSRIDFTFDGQEEVRIPIDIHGRAISPDAIKKINVPGYPNAVAIGKDVYLHGFSATEPSQLQMAQNQSVSSSGGLLSRVFDLFSTRARSFTQVTSRLGFFTQGITTIPITISGRLGVRTPDFNFIATRDVIQNNLVTAALEWAQNPDGADLMELMLTATNYQGTLLPLWWPGSISIHEALSPIGIAHYYRQLYFHKEEGVGPIEEAFTIAPLETLEVVYQTVRKQIHEEILEQGLEVVSDSAVEEKNLDEVSDKVSSMVQQDVSASMSANASGGIGVWQVGASASASFGVSSQ